MANQKISQLPAGAPAQATDLVPVARAGTNVSLQVSDIVSGKAPLASPTFTGIVTVPSGLVIGPNGQTITVGSGSPQGVVTAPVGSLYLNFTGTTATTLWIKESTAGNTGWVANAT